MDIRNGYFINISNSHLAIDIQKDGIDGGLFEECERCANEELHIPVKVVADEDYNEASHLLKVLEEDATACVIVYCGMDTTIISDAEEIEAIKCLAKDHPNEPMWESILKAGLLEV